MLLPRLRNRTEAPALLLKAAALTATLAFFCLATPPDWILCPFRLLSGLPCPLCGMTRALCALGHGQWRQAVELHALSPLIFAVFVCGLAANLRRLARRPPLLLPWTQSRALCATVAMLLGYWAWRLAR